mmetsp:Transcript_120208/g.212514  ORF Transcript_120208/g.212514 Transcript_120208/m.212514 type:complete len:215 (+) Transcript_120208:218-862(+)
MKIMGHCTVLARAAGDPPNASSKPREGWGKTPHTMDLELADAWQQSQHPQQYPVMPTFLPSRCFKIGSTLTRNLSQGIVWIHLMKSFIRVGMSKSGGRPSPFVPPSRGSSSFGTTTYAPKEDATKSAMTLVRPLFQPQTSGTMMTATAACASPVAYSFTLSKSISLPVALLSAAKYGELPGGQHCGAAPAIALADCQVLCSSCRCAVLQWGVNL